MTMMYLFLLEEIRTWGFRNNAFLFVVDSKTGTDKFNFACVLPKQMNDLLYSYVDIRLAAAQ